MSLYMRQTVLCEVRAATEETDEERNIQYIVIDYKHLRHFYDYETSVLIDGKSVDNTLQGEILCFVLGKAVISGSVSSRHGATSGCRRRNGLQYGG